MTRIVKSILLIVCVVVFIFSVYKIYQIIMEDKKSDDLNNELKNYVSYDNTHNKDISNNKNSVDNKGILSINFDELKKTNKDIIGWIYSKNEKINYPVVQSTDNNYYLRRLVNGEYNRAGTIFMDYKNNKDLNDKVTIIFGHNMKNDTMFGTLPNYENQKYYDENKNLYYFTPEKRYRIELFSSFTINSESSIYKKTEFTNDELEEFKEKSDFKNDVNITTEDKIMILSTCSYEYENSRYVVIGKIVPF